MVVILICVFNLFVALLVFMKQAASSKAVNNKPMINCPFKIVIMSLTRTREH